MTNYKLVPVKLLKDWHKRINTIAVETAFDVADEIEVILTAASAVQAEIWRHDAEDLEALHNNLDDAGTPRHDSSGVEYSAWGRVIQYAIAALQTAEQKPVPDVTQLVEALTALRGCIMETRGPDAHSALELADAAIVAYRKGEAQSAERPAQIAKVAGRQPMTKSNTEKPKYLYGQRVIVDNDTIAIFRHYENADLAIEALWVELPDGVVQWRSPHNVKPLPGGQL